MFSKELEMLINAALKDGVITDKERDILYKRAEREGFDKDEFDLILDSRMFEIQSAQESCELEPSTDVQNNPSPEFSSDNADNSEDKERAERLVKVKECGYLIYENSSSQREMIIGEAEISYKKSFADLERIEILPTTKKIAQCAFSKCSNLREVILSHGLEEIGANAFSDCKKLERIEIPTTVKEIDEFAFYECM